MGVSEVSANVIIKQENMPNVVCGYQEVELILNGYPQFNLRQLKSHS